MIHASSRGCANAVIGVKYNRGISMTSWKAVTATGTAVFLESDERTCPFCAEPIKRAAVHLELATLSMSGGQFEQAGRHFREALHLDGTLDIARQRLRELSGGVKQRRSGLRAWFSRR